MILDRIFRAARHRSLQLAVALAAGLAPGCAALTNPVADSITIAHTPPELLQTCLKDKEESVPLALLQQPPPDVYRLDTGDVLGIWVDGVLGDVNKVPIPVHTSALLTTREQRAMPPSAGYPFTVREDGTLRLPLLEPINVRGLGLNETEDTIRKAYIGTKILPPGIKLLVTLLQKRQYEIIVLRQEATAFGIGAEGGFATQGKRGAGFVINLTAYENDVLHALSVTGGLPGLDAYNQVVIYRRPPSCGPERQEFLRKLGNLPAGSPLPPEVTGSGPIIRIPLRQDPRLPLTFKPEDVVLYTGDVVFLEARDKDVYYTAGLLPAGEHILPRDRDLDILTAVSLVRGPLVNGTFGANTLNGAVFPPGLGQPSASLLVVVRRTAGGGQVPIRIDLNKALRDPRERVLVRAGDLLILQERPTEALVRWTSQTFVNFNLIWTPIQGPNATGIFDIMASDRLPGRGLYSTFTPGFSP
jgi:protein involved in polysaccharide export with SLBB domain